MRVHAALKTIARIRMNPGRAAGARRAQRIEPGTFEEDIDRLVGDGCGLTAHHPAEANHAAVVRNDAHLFADRIGLAVERFQLLALAAKTRHNRARQFFCVIGMQRARTVERDIIRHIDQQGFRLNADGLQALLYPVWRRTILHANNDGARKDRAGFRRLELDLDRTGLGAGHLFHFDMQEAPCPGRREVPRDALHAQPVRTVRCHFEINDRIAQAERLGRRHPEREGVVKIGDAVMVLTRLDLLGGAHHAIALDAADLAWLLVEREVEPRNEGAERRIDSGHARAGIWRATHDLLFAVDGIDRADAQLVRIRMRLGRLDLADGEGRQLLARVHNLLHFEASLQHQGQDIVQRRLGGEVIVQPGQGEFHRLFQFSGRIGFGRVRIVRQGLEYICFATFAALHTFGARDAQSHLSTYRGPAFVKDRAIADFHIHLAPGQSGRVALYD